MHLRFLFSALVLWLSHALLGLSEARASHAQAGELTYVFLGNNQYRVRAILSRDCSGIALPVSVPLTCRSTCAGGTPVTATLLPVTGAPNGNSLSPFCATAPGAICSTVNATYEATVTLPPAAEWILSVEESARPAVANITAGNLRLEATLNKLITPAGGGTPIAISNNSPQFNTQSQPVAFVCWQQRSTISFSATDVDRFNTNGFGQPRADSLVYSLDRPLTGCGVYEMYETYPTALTCFPRVDPNCSTRLIRCMGASSTYSATLPIAVGYDTIRSGPCISHMISTADLRPRFSFNAQAASFTFTPALYNVTPDSPLNKYVVVGKVTEYRKINGRTYKVGSVRRDFLVIVVDCGSNLSPQPPIAALTDTLGTNFGNTLDTTYITVRTCNYTRVNLRFTDPNPADLLTVVPPANLNTTLLQNGDVGSFTLIGNGTTQPRATFHFQPGTGLAGTTIMVPFRVEDNGCPLKGIQYRVVAIHIVNGTALHIGAGATNVRGGGLSTCLGDGASVLLTGNIQRPDSVRQFASGRTIQQVYAYQWTGGAAGGLPAVTNTRSIVVTPLVTTRYHLRVTPTMGFAPGCGDTTSVLVRVVPQPQAPTVTQVGNTLVSSAPTGNQWYLNGQPIAGATGTTYTPSTSGNYSVVMNLGTGSVTCRSPHSGLRAVALGTSAAVAGVSVRVAPNPIPDGRVRVELIGYERPVTLRVHDALGRVVTTTQVAAPNPAGTEQVLNLPGTAAGVYVLQIVGATGVQVIRLVRE